MRIPHRYVFSRDLKRKHGYIMFYNTTIRWYHAPGKLHGYTEDWFPAAWELSEIKT